MDDVLYARLQALLGLSPLVLSPLGAAPPGERAARLVFSPAFHATTVVTARHAPDAPSADLHLVTCLRVGAHLMAEQGYRGFALEDELRTDHDLGELPRERFEALWLKLEAAARLPPTRHLGRDGCDVELELMTSPHVRRVMLSTQDDEMLEPVSAILSELVWPATGWAPDANAQLQVLARYLPSPRR